MTCGRRPLATAIFSSIIGDAGGYVRKYVPSYPTLVLWTRRVCDAVRGGLVHLLYQGVEVLYQYTPHQCSTFCSSPVTSVW